MPSVIVVFFVRYPIIFGFPFTNLTITGGLFAYVENALHEE
jgi:hypothetical protein